jgi:Tfp pilus assembly protein PilF
LGELAKLIRGSAIKDRLLTALDDWVAAVRRTDEQVWHRLLELARQADDDAWRNQFRHLLRTQDRQALRELAKEEGLQDQSPATIVLLAWALKQVDERPLTIEVLRRMQKRFPDDFWINHELASYLVVTPGASMDEVAGFYRAALALRPDSAAVHSNLGLALLNQGKLDESEFHHRQALRLAPQLVKTRNNLGIILGRLGKLSEAEEVYREALRIDPDNARLRNNLASDLRKLNRLSEAEAECRESLRIAPNNPRANYNMALIVLAQERFGDAVSAFEEALRHDPNFIEARTGLIGLLVNSPDPALWNPTRALELAEKTTQQQPEGALAWELMGIACYRTGDFNGALSALDRSLRLHGSGGRHRLFMAMAHSQLGNQADAYRFYHRACEVLPEALNRATETQRDELDRNRKEAAEVLGIDP